MLFMVFRISIIFNKEFLDPPKRSQQTQKLAQLQARLKLFVLALLRSYGSQFSATSLA